MTCGLKTNKDNILILKHKSMLMQLWQVLILKSDIYFMKSDVCLLTCPFRLKFKCDQQNRV